MGARIKIKVENMGDLNKLKKLEFFNEENYFKDTDTSFCIDSDWDERDDKLRLLVIEIASVLKNCIVIADTQDIDVDPYKFCVYYFGKEVKWKCFDSYVKVEKIDDTDIESIAEWLNVTKVRLSESEKMHLEKYGIEYIKDEKKYIDRIEEENKKKQEEERLIQERKAKEIFEKKAKKDLEIDTFYLELVGTHFDGRESRIEKLKCGDEVNLIREFDNQYDSNAILICNDEGSLGHISAINARILSPIIDNELITIDKVVVEEVCPKSKLLNSKRKGGYVEVKVKYSLTEKAEPYYKELVKDESYLKQGVSVIVLKILCSCGLIDEDYVRNLYN